MANWCSNSTTFTKGDLKGLAALLEAGKQVMEKENRGWLPLEVEERDLRRYFFNMSIEVNPKYVFIQYETKWAPPLDELVLIADMFGCSFSTDYEECGMAIYGQANSSKETGLVDTYLDEAEINKVVYDEDTDTYTFEGEVYDSEFEAYEILLERKLKGGKV
jgi:hypothetical protein